ncbi:hypothetical protein DAPPUDRAFT_338244, partial [Daphnia pulex]
MLCLLLRKYEDKVKISVKAFYVRLVETRITSFTKDIDELFGRKLGGAMANYLAETHTDAFMQTMVEKEADGIMESLNESDKRYGETATDVLDAEYDEAWNIVKEEIKTALKKHVSRDEYCNV